MKLSCKLWVKLTELKLRSRQQCKALAPFLGHCQTRNEAQIVIIMDFRVVLGEKFSPTFNIGLSLTES